ncbi:30S ribosomal protein 3, chloroplastic-like [Amaranthus tricolor]|uniref:30S ribosomal protein 3, chloroplastic-like n=1 Tax=Amaranthus tricolor TaxID=29722 RepID=UPI002585DF25|nr:30S ribosomal protein 3, chloroplastic-like [Amaranthus tricolor]XP_057522243.1 30S ribosomal protein 3, chloroplastic-like [Amaranthus tricolor]
MFSMAVQPNINAIVKPSTYPSPILSLKPFKVSTFGNPKSHSSPSFPQLKKKDRYFSLAAAPETVSDTVDIDDDLPINIKKLKVEVKPMDKPRLVLKFIWMEKNIGLALDQTIPGHGTIPLSPYYFWPRKDAWEELKVLLESKPWISQKQMIIILNQATDIINLWQQSGGNPAS